MAQLHATSFFLFRSFPDPLLSSHEDNKLRLCTSAVCHFLSHSNSSFRHCRNFQFDMHEQTILQTDVLLFIVHGFNGIPGSLWATISHSFDQVCTSWTPNQFQCLAVAKDNFTAPDRTNTPCIGAGIWTEQTNRNDGDSQLNCCRQDPGSIVVKHGETMWNSFSWKVLSGWIMVNRLP